MKTIIFTILFCLGNMWGFAQKNSAIFLHHSTGDGVYSGGNVSNWVTNYNSTHGTNFQIIPRTYPNTPYPWENYPYDYWKLWVNNSCNNSNPNIECLSSIANNCGLVIFKHCFPGASVNPDTGSPDITSSRKSLENYKLQYRALRTLMDGMPDKKFMVWTLVPLHRLATTTEEADRAYEFVKWVKNQWLTEDGKNHPNIFIFDFFSLAAELNSNPVNGQQYCLKYDYEGSHSSNDSHPNSLANQTIGPLFAKAVVDVLTTNYYITNISINSQNGEREITIDQGSLQMQTSILPIDALSKSVTWSVANLTGEATINSTGLLKAKKDGTVKVVATANDGSGIKGELLVSITNQIIPVESITVSSAGGTTITADNGTLQLLAVVLPADATNKSVNWSVVNLTGRASISTSGWLSAEKDGKVKAIATATDGSGIRGELQITISNQLIPVESITVSSAGGTTITSDNGTLQIQATVLPADATSKSIAWSVLNVTGQASISPSGLLTAEKNGTVEVIASANDGSGVKGIFIVAISNQQILVEHISIIDNLTEDTINGIGTELTLTTSTIPSDATNQNITWSIENITGKASIDILGKLTTVAPGLIKVVARTNDGSEVFTQKEYTIAFTNDSHILNNNDQPLVFKNLSNETIQIDIDEIPSEGVLLSIRNVLGQKIMEKWIYNKSTVLTFNQIPHKLVLVTIKSRNSLITKKIFIK